MKVLITGITGFAAHYLAEHLLAAGDTVLGTVQAEGAVESAADVERLVWDIREAPSAETFAAADRFAPSHIVHLAALSTPVQCGDREPTSEAVSVNVDGTRRVCELAARLASRPRVLFASSGRVYGDVDQRSPRIDESHRAHPVTAYAKSKLLAEEQVRGVCRDAHLEYVILRAFNHTGPRQLPPLMLPQWCEEIATGSDVLHVRNPNVWMDLCDVRDVVRAYRRLAVDGTAGGVYNVGSGIAVRTGDIAERLIRASGRNVTLQFEHETECYNAIADINRLQSETKWSPEISLDRTIAQTWAYWVERTARTS